MEAKYFVHALEKFINGLEKGRLDLSSKKIIVFSVAADNKNKPKFINSLSRLIKGTLLESLVSTVDASGLFTKEDYFSLDAHINEKGHKKIARLLSDKYFLNSIQKKNTLS
jgi:hypothetical protein